MRRRAFMGAALATVIPGASQASARDAAPRRDFQPCVFEAMPTTIAGMTLEELRDDCRRRLFDEYLPFWDRGGFDRRLGGFTCDLNDDGSVFSDEKHIWYQGRAVWVYSFLYNHFGKDERFLEIARKTRDFMVKHMRAGGRWRQKVGRDGTLVEGPAKNVYGALFAAGGLAEYFKAAQDPEDLDLAKQSIREAVRAYDEPDYGDTHTTQYTAVKIPEKGVRSQGHSMVIVWILSGLLTAHRDPRLEQLARRHVDLIMTRFWNPEYGIANEYLRHDYSRIPEAESHMFAGHALETLWIVMHEALRVKDRTLFTTAKDRIRRLLEMCWDYVFDGWGDGNFFVHQTADHGRGPEYEIKTMWAHCEILIACLSILEYTGEVWAKQWYERVWAFTLRAMANTGHGVWRQAVDRCGNDVKRVGVSSKRKGNFHQPRCLMMNILSLDRIIENAGNRTAFPQ
ncbi:MAG: AGE family epimerase/isomerase [Planctomycetota bacterium]|jgi:mannose/cellobiose epimerase-like protein (N-acyl-D-glucosamine 2-epimerase family)